MSDVYAQQIASTHTSTLPVHVDASCGRCCERAQDTWTLRWIRGKFLHDCFVSKDLNVSSRLVLDVHVFLTLKAMGPIDCHYMTDRRRFELKIFVCVLLKKQGHLHLGCPGDK